MIPEKEWDTKRQVSWKMSYEDSISAIQAHDRTHIKASGVKRVPLRDVVPLE